MLAIPEFGFQSSVQRHNCELVVVCDWIEASLLSEETEVSQAQVADIFHEQGFYQKSSGNLALPCAEFMEMVWTEMERRESLVGKAAPFQMTGKRIVRRGKWEEFSPATFLLVLACADYFSGLRARPLNNYIEQGELFEDFCVLSLAGNGWQTTRTGWASHQGAQKLPKTVAAVAAALDERAINAAVVELYKHENEAGCDLVSHWAYPDRWTGRPVVLLQCASGDNFKTKLGTPSIDVWRKLIGFSTIPLRGFCTPRTFENRSFLQHGGKVSGLFLDRFRLLQPFAEAPDTLPADLKRRLLSWLRPRIKAMPRLN